ncbi:MAG: hypothetical protein U5Q03_03080 [Bacteroidota bacterium]|nr:hypothetical protein [Bacteroidota bacterium]
MLITDNTMHFQNQYIDFPIDYRIKIIMVKLYLMIIRLCVNFR